MDDYDEYWFSAPFTSDRFEICDTLDRNSDKLQRFIADWWDKKNAGDGSRHIHFITTRMNNLGEKVIKQCRHKMHSKVFLFVNNMNDWKCFMGSSNFTYGGFVRNHETVVMFDQNAPVEGSAYDDIMGYFDDLMYNK